ncbi:MAG TPA: hypothetical protein PLR32_04130 [candidate division Zixibacteria bacterium]|nr:hypothetical protein [candidate division Zixibacteria bacterium]MDM7973832.1 hypothetical protein [candidate division Zixibacteria bacterium]HOD66382.1 hypothetical protein [candidate division Zixibacteria bacterium]HOZ08495.1 hypothetical protein [candidate division Zixibacteria bacterium]HPI32481.1 hypothetical protein [candidate division Zixibacteria bacterium]
MNLIGLVIAVALLAFVHESLHAATAALFGEYGSFRVHWYGFEVIYRTAVELRAGIHWALIAGLPNLVTVLLGYLLLTGRSVFARIAPLAGRSLAYWATLIFLLADPLNIAVGPFLYGGDAGGIAHGLGLNQYFLQALAFGVFLWNRELVASRLLPAFGVVTSHPLFRPWLSGGPAAGE